MIDYLVVFPLLVLTGLSNTLNNGKAQEIQWRCKKRNCRFTQLRKVFQGHYEKTADYKTLSSSYCIYVWVTALPGSGRRSKLSSSDENKLVRMFWNSPGTIKAKAWTGNCWNSNITVHSKASFTSPWTERLPAQKKSPCFKIDTSSLKFSLSHTGMSFMFYVLSFMFR